MTQHYQYDDAGNLEQRSGPLQPLLRLAYNRLRMPSEMGTILGGTDSVHFAYDAFGERVRKTGSESETVYLDDAFSRASSTSSSGYVERFVVSAGDRQIAEIMREASGDDAVSYLHADHLGTVELVTDEDGNELEHRQYEAFGKRRGVTGTAASDHPLTGPYVAEGVL